jgi:hypothetical protein
VEHPALPASFRVNMVLMLGFIIAGSFSEEFLKH